MNRSLRTTLHSLGLVLLPSALLAAPAQATQSAKPDAASTARCITDHLPRGAQLYRASDGSFRVVAFGLRGSVARWSIEQDADAIRVTQTSGAAGSARTVKGVCY